MMLRPAAVVGVMSLASPAVAAVPSQMKVELIASTLSPRPGSMVLVGFRMDPQPGWHGYWSNAGGNGVAPAVSWAVPNGVKVGPLLHPAPTLFKSMGVVSYVHSGEHVLVSRMTLPPNLRPGTPIPVRAHLSWAVCSDDLCVPGNASFSLEMTTGLGIPTSQAQLLSTALANVPQKVSGGSFWDDSGALTLAMPEGIRLRPQSARFFPDENGFYDATRARVLNGLPLRIFVPTTVLPPARIDGVVSDGIVHYRVSLARVSSPPESATSDPRRAKGPAPQTSQKTFAPPAELPKVKRDARQSFPSPSYRPWAALLALLAVAGTALMFFRGRRRDRP